jgi:protein tyrosine phosphatase (PTP) superfamily phosphohydrolase (DUF442 family)
MRLSKNRMFRAAAIAIVAAAASVTAAAQTGRERVDGVTNFGRVTDRYFRGGKVTPVGVENLARLGVRTIIDLRDDPNPEEPEACAKLGITYYNFGLNGHATPDDATVDKVLGMIRDADAPVYVHCSAGKHRAGTVCALYRMKVQGWSADRAWAEQQEYGFGAREEHPELFAFAYDGGYAGHVGADPVASAASAARSPLAAAPVSQTRVTTVATVAAAPAALSTSARYLALADVVVRAKARGATGEILKIDLEYDIERTFATWDVTFTSGLEYEFDAVTGAYLGAKPKAAAKLAIMVPVGDGAKSFLDVMRAAEASAKQPVQEMELKHIKGTPRTVFEVVMADGVTIVYDAATGEPVPGA